MDHDRENSACESREYQIVSVPFPSGVSWLLNILLELKLKTTSNVHLNNHWVEDGATSHITDPAYEHLRWHFPVLHRQRAFEFAPDIEIFWEHRLDYARFAHRPTILFVRDPRDAIYSNYRRQPGDIGPLLDYLRLPESWPLHFPKDLFELPPTDTWALFHLFWLEMAKFMKIKIVTFEGMRKAPLETLDDILAFLGTSRPDDEKEVAIQNSTFTLAQKAMQATEKASGQVWLTARKGQVDEWQETYGDEELAQFQGLVKRAMAAFGYPTIDATDSEPNGTAFDLGSARGVHADIGDLFGAAERNLGQHRDTAFELRFGLALAIVDQRRQPAGDKQNLILAGSIAHRWAQGIFESPDDDGIDRPKTVHTFGQFAGWLFEFAQTPHIKHLLEAERDRLGALVEAHLNALKQAGQAAFSEGDYLSAVQHFEVFTSDFPWLADGFFALGTALMRLRQFDRAAEVLQHATKLAPFGLVIYDAWHRALLSSGKASQAQKVLNLKRYAFEKSIQMQH